MTTESLHPTEVAELIDSFLNSLKPNERNNNERELLLGLSPPANTLIESKDFLRL